MRATRSPDARKFGAENFYAPPELLCAVTPASVRPAGRPRKLETRLRPRDGASTGAITMRQVWRCVRDRKDEFSGIRPVGRKRLAARRGWRCACGRSG